MIFLFVLLAIFILLVMVTIHEFGHYVAAKILKFKVVEFSVGFGPLLFQKTTKSGELFSLRAIPLGGYCAFESEDDDGVETEKSFYKEKPWKRIIVLFSGAFFNIISAVLFSFIFLLAVGFPSTNAVRVAGVFENVHGTAYNQLLEGDVITHINGVAISTVANSPYTIDRLSRQVEVNTSADITILRDNLQQIVPVMRRWISQPSYDGFGFTYRLQDGGAFVGGVTTRVGGFYYSDLQVRDVITSVNGEAVTGNVRLSELIGDVELGDAVIFGITRTLRCDDGYAIEVITKEVTISKMVIEPAFLGFGFTQGAVYERSFFRALGEAFPLTARLSWAIIGSFGRIFTGDTAVTEMTGPVGTVTQMAQISQMDWRNILLLLPLLASNLAIFNLLPFPALDGAKIVFTTIEWIRKRPVPRHIENMIHMLGFLALMLFVITLDIVGFFIRGRPTGWFIL